MKISKVHFVGIKGVGMTALAIYCAEKGIEVTGSDVPQEFPTDEILNHNLIRVYPQFSAAHINKKLDLIVYSGAFDKTKNEEIIKATSQHVKTLSLAEAVSLFTRDKKVICIAGTHGKTTTTSLLATIMTEAGKDPSYLFGAAKSAPLVNPGHYGKGKYFVIEGDEYQTEVFNNKKSRFLWLSPLAVIITNIEFDHPDVFDSLSAVRKVFISLVKKIPPHGCLVYNQDDPNLAKILKFARCKKISFGTSPESKFQLVKYKSKDTSIADIKINHGQIVRVNSPLHGIHNMLNIISCIALSSELKLPLKNVLAGIHKFKGAQRRMELIKISGTNYYYDDYAHHPTEIKATLKTLKEKHEKTKLIAIFQPHTYSRTAALIEDFARGFTDSDEVIIVPIYASAREIKTGASVTEEKFTSLIAKYHKNVHYIENMAKVVKYLQSKKLSHTVVVTMGAGDIYKLHHNLI